MMTLTSNDREHWFDKIEVRKRKAGRDVFGRLIRQEGKAIMTNAIGDQSLMLRVYQQTQFPTRGVS